MKQVYFAPDTTIVSVEAPSIMQASNAMLDKYQSIDGSSVRFGSRRGHSDWDDEEE